MESKRINYVGFVLGIILLIPPLCSVFIFFTQLMGWDTSHSLNIFNSPIWSGRIDIDYFTNAHTVNDEHVLDGGGGGGGGFTSALPLYFGLMAIAGSILVSNSTKK